MKIAVVGKGGSGKTTLAGTLVRIFAERGRPIIAIDSDHNPNLAVTLGMSRVESDKIQYVPSSVMEAGERVDGVVMMRPTIPRHQIIERYAVRAADNVDLLVMGKPAEGSAGSGCMGPEHRAVRGLIAELSSIGDHTMTDMEAGLEHLKRGTARNVNLMLVVAEPYYRSLEAAMRIYRLASELKIPFVQVVANKVRSREDLAAIDAFCLRHGMNLIAIVPYDETVAEAEQNEQSPFDFAPDSAGIRAIRKLATAIDALT